MSALTDQIAAVLRQHRCIWSMDGHTLSKCLCGWSGDVDHATHIAERVEIAMRDMGIVGFVYNDKSKRVPRVYTDANAEVWADRP